MRRHFSGAPSQTQALVGECTDAIIAEVEALKGLVDEFAQFARLRGPAHGADRSQRLVEDTLQSLRRRAAEGDAADRAAAGRRACPPCGSTPNRFGRSSSTSWTTRWRRSADPPRPAPERRAADDHRADHARRRGTASCGSSSATTARVCRPRTVTSCSCRTTRPKGGAAASASRSCAASSSSTAAASRSATPRPSGTTFTVELPAA